MMRGHLTAGIEEGGDQSGDSHRREGDLFTAGREHPLPVPGRQGIAQEDDHVQGDDEMEG